MSVSTATDHPFSGHVKRFFWNRRGYGKCFPEMFGAPAPQSPKKSATH